MNETIKKPFNEKYRSLINNLEKINDDEKAKKIALRSFYQILEKYPLFAKDLGERYQLDKKLIKAAEMRYDNKVIEKKINENSRFQKFLRAHTFDYANIKIDVNKVIREINNEKNNK
ncbi:hypothetical protein M1278_03080 [Candidatus Marsarchaeota archaeon]|nr:hypothetical protein [Candidatus Marsarchaeota archaeon]